MPKEFPVVAAAQRALVVRAYAHSIVEDLLGDRALDGQPVVLIRDLPVAEAEDLGIRFEETFLQGNAPQWSVGCGNAVAREWPHSVDALHEAAALRKEALELADRLLLAGT